MTDLFGGAWIGDAFAELGRSPDNRRVSRIGGTINALIKGIHTALVVDEAERYLTIQEAAGRAGYRRASNLHAAGRRGRLKTPTAGPLHTRVTTQEWLDEFLASLCFNTQFRGKPEDSVNA